MTMTAPVADARILGLAHYAARGVLEHVLARHGLTHTAPVTARIWGGIPSEDLAAAGRVLALVTERANVELTALTA
ncbi:hypothetical protein EF910_00010 [Streptomyces sp. WAC07149]|uniref:hypothetical protein n=1 Tax=Streptomyces sp. WAC07149 TaxID=2487425 RepID=UPI000F7AA7F8|nr:hypothetical protein [Streptomyces sp. WAC07149]RST08678.1 hypothetical protein EF910_00010 [Streptomyces sp. WAC07149]